MTCSSSNWGPKFSSIERWLKYLSFCHYLETFKNNFKKTTIPKNYEKLNPPLAHPLSTLELDIVPRAGVRNEYRKCY